MRALRIVLEGEEFLDPRLRKYAVRARREQSDSKGRSVLKPVTLDVWTLPHADVVGTLPADWDAVGVDPPTGRCSLALTSTGQTTALLVTPESDEHWLVLEDRAFLAVFARPTYPAPAWPWRVVRWHDVHALRALLGTTVVVWPRRHDGFFDPFSEPLRVTSAHVGSDGRHGVGLTPVLQPTNHALPDNWPLRRLSDDVPFRTASIGLTQAVRPLLVLWSAVDADKPTAYLQTPADGLSDNLRWNVLGDTPYQDVRLVMADPVGSDPDVWEGVAVPAPWAAAKINTTSRAWIHCWACEDDGVVGQHVLVKSKGLCLMHYSRAQNYDNSLALAQQRAFRTVPRLGFDKGVPVRLDLTAGLPVYEDEDD